MTTQAETNLVQNSKTRAWSATSKLKPYQIQPNENRANLTCRSEHVTGNQLDTSILNVLYKPVVSLPQSSYSVMEDTTLRIPCTVDANPPTTVSWRRIGSNVPIKPSSIGSSYDPNVLQWDKVSKSLDGALIECFPKNEYGDSEPAVTHINVLCK